MNQSVEVEVFTYYKEGILQLILLGGNIISLTMEKAKNIFPLLAALGSGMSKSVQRFNIAALHTHKAGKGQKRNRNESLNGSHGFVNYTFFPNRGLSYVPTG
ncbi:hypothetical protein [Aneurinibacillus terranovensis]|uniref:hypothetical protein n=1 Tax=Aneurinibacillus terranovensis TaxID=278991 RepID=UPI000421474D|nr:hypothetical protein [Aneurinibacillus terranovensis]